MALLWAETTELNLSEQFQNGTAPILPFSPYYAMVNSHAPIDALPSESFLRLSSGVFGGQPTLPSITSPLAFVTTPPRIRINHHPDPSEVPIARGHDQSTQEEVEGHTVDRSTDSVSRGFSDLDFPKFVFAVAALTAARTVVSQPLCVALTKKQACAEFASRSTLSIMRQTYRSEGLRRGLLRGCLAMALGQIATDVITFGVFEYLRERFAQVPHESKDESTSADGVGSSSFSSSENGQSNLTTFLSGYTGDAICQAVRIPFLVIGIRQIMDSSANPANIRQTTQQLYKAGGFRSLYAGLGTTLLVGSQWTGLWWLVYGVSKDTLYTGYRGWLGVEEGDTAAQRMEKARRKFSSKLIPSWAIHTEDNGTINSLASCFTSASTAVVFNPYLVIRTRLQAEVGSTILGVTRQVFREAGIRGFFHGTVLNINACIFDAWLASTTYEWAKLYADKSNA